jgi:hypothetical protein
LRQTLPIRNRQHLKRLFPSSFVGSECVSLIVSSGYAVTRAKAIEVGKEMVEKRLVRHVTDGHDFKDDFLYYRCVSFFLLLIMFSLFVPFNLLPLTDTTPPSLTTPHSLRSPRTLDSKKTSPFRTRRRTSPPRPSWTSLRSSRPAQAGVPPPLLPTSWPSPSSPQRRFTLSPITASSSLPITPRTTPSSSPTNS